MIRTELAFPELYIEDETAWLEAMAEQIQAGRFVDLDYPNLGEYLSDMAKRDRREVESRLVVLLTHILKWIHQPCNRSRTWQSTIIERRQELVRLASRGVLRVHAATVLNEVYLEAVERAAAETGLAIDSFPVECEYSVQHLFTFDPIAFDI